MQEGLKRQELTKKVMILRGQGYLTEVLQRIGLRYKTSLGLQSGSSLVPSMFLKASGDRVSNPKFKKGKGTNSPN